MTDVTLSMEQLQAVIASAVTAALDSRKTGPRKPKAEPTAEQSEKDAAKVANRDRYLVGKKQVALKLMLEKGVHYGVYEKGRKLFVWSDLTHDKARRDGRPESIGKRIWNTASEYSLSGNPMPGVTPTVAKP